MRQEDSKESDKMVSGKERKINLKPYWTHQRFDCIEIKREISNSPLWETRPCMDIKILEEEEDGQK